MSVHLLIHFIIYNLSLLCLSLHGSLQVEVVVCVCVSVRYLWATLTAVLKACH